MIARLKGLVDSVSADSVIVDVNGVGYLVQASTRMLASLSVGQPVALHIETQVREDAITSSAASPNPNSRPSGR